MDDATVEIADVTLREHGQTVSASGLDAFDVELRVATARRLLQAGVRRLELLSCVSPRVAPAMAPALVRELAHRVGRHSGTRIVTLVPNRRGLDTFAELGLGPEGLGHHVGIFLSAVEEHNRANLGRSRADSLREYRRLAADLRAERIPLTAYVSGAFGYRPAPTAPVIDVPDDDLRDLVLTMVELGAETVTLSDLQGVRSPAETRQTLERLSALLPAEDRARLGYHPHHADPAAGLALVEAAYAAGIRRFDASLGATGGCVTGAPGNVATEGVMALLAGLGARTGVSLPAIRQAADAFSGAVDHP